MKSKITFFSLVLVVTILIFILGRHFYLKSEKERSSIVQETNSSYFVRDHSPVYGNKDAKVTLVEFLDPECETCRKMYPVVKLLMKKYEGKIKLVVRYAPFHKNSKQAIAVLESARMQGKYWETLGVMFKYQPVWADHHNPKPELVFNYLPEAGVDVAKVKENLNNPSIQYIINTDMQDLQRLEVRATPTFFVNGKPLEQFGVEYLYKLVDSEVSANY